MGHGDTECECFSFRRLWNSITRRGYLSLTEDDQAAAMDVQGDADIEPEPTHLQLGIRIEKLTKVSFLLFVEICVYYTEIVSLCASLLRN